MFTLLCLNLANFYYPEVPLQWNNGNRVGFSPSNTTITKGPECSKIKWSMAIIKGYKRKNFKFTEGIQNLTIDFEISCQNYVRSFVQSFMVTVWPNMRCQAQEARPVDK